MPHSPRDLLDRKMTGEKCFIGEREGPQTSKNNNDEVKEMEVGV
jgi:hypothetical protein